MSWERRYLMLSLLGVCVGLNLYAIKTTGGSIGNFVVSGALVGAMLATAGHIKR